jgi:hypothetical protein
MRISQSELTRILAIRRIAFDLVQKRGLIQGKGPIKRTVITYNGVRVSYWADRRAMRELPPDSPGLVKNLEFTDTKLPYLLTIDYKSSEMFGRVMSLEWDENGNLEVHILHPGEWERLLEADVPVTVH